MNQEILEQISRNESIIYCEVSRDDTDAKDLREMAKDFDYRIAWILLDLVTFHSAIQAERSFMFLYKGNNFNLQPPGLPPYRRTTYDAMLEASKEHTLDYMFEACTPEDFYLMEYLPNGWSLADLYQYDCTGLPQASVDMYRPPVLYYSQLNKMSEKVIIHPIENRPITNEELASLYSNTLQDWLQNLMQLQIDNYWKDVDFESAYCGFDSKWMLPDVHKVIYESNGLQKTYDMRQYKSYQTKKHKVVELPHKFNVKNGKLITDWETIRQRNST